MYQPPDMASPTYPVPAKINGRIVSFISGKGAIAAGAALAVSLALYFGVGSMSAQVEVEAGEYEQGAALTQLKAERAALVYDEAKEQMKGYLDERGLPRAELSESERSRYQAASKAASEAGMAVAAKSDAERAALRRQAAEDGVTADSTDEELSSKVPATKVEEVPVMDQMQRFVLLLVMPVGVVLAAVVEPMGMQSLAGMAADRIQFNRRRREFLYERMAPAADGEEETC